MTNEIIPQEQFSLTPIPTPRQQLSYLDAIKAIDAIAPDDRTATMMFGMTANQAKMVMWTGYEIGLKFTSSLRVIYMQDGKMVLRPEGAWALIQSSGQMDWYTWLGEADRATMTIKRKGRPPVSMTITLQEAQAAGWKSTAWKTDPASMMRWRLIGRIAKLDWTDWLLGLPIADDSWMDIEVSSEGDILEMHKEVPLPIPSYGLTLAKLMELAASDDILAANEGAFPVTPEQINVVAHRLIEAGKLVLPNGSPDA